MLEDEPAVGTRTSYIQVTESLMLLCFDVVYRHLKQQNERKHSMTFVNMIMIRSTINIGNKGSSQVFVYTSVPVCIVLKGSSYKQCFKNMCEYFVQMSTFFSYLLLLHWENILSVGSKMCVTCQKQQTGTRQSSPG